MIIRSAEPPDAMEVARIHVACWQTAYRQLLPDDYLDALNAEDRARKYTFAVTDPGKPATYVAAEDSRILGFVTTGPARDGDGRPVGEVYALHVNPASWGRHVGAALITAARERLSSLGFDRAILWMLVGNSRAERFYRIDGWLPDGSSRTDIAWGASVNEVRFARNLAGS